jgi:hypothetical protein
MSDISYACIHVGSTDYSSALAPSRHHTHAVRAPTQAQKRSSSVICFTMSCRARVSTRRHAGAAGKSGAPCWRP